MLNHRFFLGAPHIRRGRDSDTSATHVNINHGRILGRAEIPGDGAYSEDWFVPPPTIFFISEFHVFSLS